MIFFIKENEQKYQLQNIVVGTFVHFLLPQIRINLHGGRQCEVTAEWNTLVTKGLYFTQAGQ